MSSTPTLESRADTEQEYDLVIAGSGAAGLSAAIAAAHQGSRVLVLEKEPRLGGTSAISGGWLWMPGNRKGVADGDTRDDAEAYLRAVGLDSVKPESVAAFLDAAPEAAAFLEQHSQVDFLYADTAPDYQMDQPGARRSGRGITVHKADARTLGARRLELQPYLYTTTVFGYMPEIGKDLATIIKASHSFPAFLHIVRRVSRTWIETILFRRSLVRTNGNGYLTRLLATALDAGVEIRHSSPVVGLERDEDGVVRGVSIGGSSPGRVRARHGVLLASGGFTGDTALRQQLFRHETDGRQHRTPTIGHGGDSYRLAATVGGILDTTVHQPAAWAPVTTFRTLRGRERVFPHLRAFGLPGLIAVNREGRRFANESKSYHDFGMAMIDNNLSHPDTYAFIIGDRTSMRKYGIGYAKPFPLPSWYYRRIGYLIRGRTIAELGRRAGIDPVALEETIAEFNTHARRGEDPVFQRGSTEFHHFKGDMDHRPNPNLAALDRGPYYAVKIHMGDLGSFAGLAVSPRAEVLDETGTAIPGLYAAGTAAVSPFGGAYPGFGSNLGPATVFGYLVGRDAERIARAREAEIAGKTASP